MNKGFVRQAAANAGQQPLRVSPAVIQGVGQHDRTFDLLRGIGRLGDGRQRPLVTGLRPGHGGLERFRLLLIEQTVRQVDAAPQQAHAGKARGAELHALPRQAGEMLPALAGPGVVIGMTAARQQAGKQGFGEMVLGRRGAAQAPGQVCQVEQPVLAVIPPLQPGLEGSEDFATAQDARLHGLAAFQQPQVVEIALGLGHLGLQVGHVVPAGEVVGDLGQPAEDQLALAEEGLPEARAALVGDEQHLLASAVQRLQQLGAQQGQRTDAGDGHIVARQFLQPGIDAFRVDEGAEQHLVLVPVVARAAQELGVAVRGVAEQAARMAFEQRHPVAAEGVGDLFQAEVLFHDVHQHPGGQVRGLGQVFCQAVCAGAPEADLLMQAPAVPEIEAGRFAGDEEYSLRAHQVVILLRMS